MNMYKANYEETTEELLKHSFEAGDATLIHSRGDNGGVISKASITHEDYSVRGEVDELNGETYLVNYFDETWTSKPRTLQDLLDVSSGKGILPISVGD